MTVNPNTVVRAYRELEVAGIAEKRRTAGTFVADQGSPLARRERTKLVTEQIDQLLAEAEQNRCAVNSMLSEEGSRSTLYSRWKRSSSAVSRELAKHVVVDTYFAVGTAIAGRLDPT